MTDELERRIERVERHIGVSGGELAWREYINRYSGTYADIVDVGGWNGAPYVDFLISELPNQHTEWRENFTKISIRPHNGDVVKVTAYAPDNWREKLEDDTF